MRERECSCPDFVIKCAHFGEQKVELLDRYLLPDAVQVQFLRAADLRYYVPQKHEEYHSIQDAEAAFHEAVSLMV